jgi:two-component system nitrate/nitrite response regulator NarL
MNSMQNKDRIRLLLLDDHSLFRESLGRLLRSEPDLEVIADFHSACEAIAALEKIKVDVILLDHDLGEQDGLGVLATLKGLRFAGKILFVTAGMSDEETRSAVSRGASGIFLKHSSPADLLTAIRRVAAGEQWFDRKALLALSSGSREANLHRGKSDGVPPFNPREQSVLDEIFSGLTNKEIAAKLNISEGYVKAVLQQLFAKTGVRTRSQLVRIALEAQIARR